MLREEREKFDAQIQALNKSPLLLLDDDVEEVYTLVFWLNKPEWKKKYENLIYEFEKSSEGLYLYDFDRLHMTLLAGIEKKINIGELIKVVRENVIEKKIMFNIGSLACNERSVSIIAEPQFDLAEMRKRIRSGLGVKSDDYTKYLSIYERLAWINFIRFKNYPKETFFETLWQMRNIQFGAYEAKDVDICTNSSRTLDPAKCRLVERIVF